MRRCVGRTSCSCSCSCSLRDEGGFVVNPQETMRSPRGFSPKSAFSRLQPVGNGENARHLKAQVLELQPIHSTFRQESNLFRELRPAVPVIVSEKWKHQCRPDWRRAALLRAMRQSSHSFAFSQGYQRARRAKARLRRRSGAAVAGCSDNQP